MSFFNFLLKLLFYDLSSFLLLVFSVCIIFSHFRNAFYILKYLKNKNIWKIKYFYYILTKKNYPIFYFDKNLFKFFILNFLFFFDFIFILLSYYLFISGSFFFLRFIYCNLIFDLDDLYIYIYYLKAYVYYYLNDLILKFLFFDFLIFLPFSKLFLIKKFCFYLN